MKKILAVFYLIAGAFCFVLCFFYFSNAIATCGAALIIIGLVLLVLPEGSAGV